MCTDFGGFSLGHAHALPTAATAAHHPLPLHQLEFHPYVLKHLEPVLKIQKEHGIITESYGPLTPTLRHPQAGGGPLAPVLQEIAKAVSQRAGTELDTNAVLLLWCKAHDVVAVTASANPDRIKGLAQLAKLDVNLTPDEVKQIDETGSKYHFRYYVGSGSTEDSSHGTLLSPTWILLAAFEYGFREGGIRSC